MVEVDAGDHTAMCTGGLRSTEYAHVGAHVRAIPAGGEVEWVREDSGLPSLEGNVGLAKPWVLKLEGWIYFPHTQRSFTTTSTRSGGGCPHQQNKQQGGGGMRRRRTTRHWSGGANGRQAVSHMSRLSLSHERDFILIWTVCHSHLPMPCL